MLAFTRAAARRHLLLTLTIALSGCAGLNSTPMPTEAALMTIQPGMTRADVEARFGRPFWVFGVRKDHMTILNYRFNRNECVIYQVGVLPDGIVSEAGPGMDPACDGPNDKS
jgi:hypothetical protein